MLLGSMVANDGGAGRRLSDGTPDRGYLKARAASPATEPGLDGRALQRGSRAPSPVRERESAMCLAVSERDEARSHSSLVAWLCCTGPLAPLPSPAPRQATGTFGTTTRVPVTYLPWNPRGFIAEFYAAILSSWSRHRTPRWLEHVMAELY